MGNPRDDATACSMRETRETALLHAWVQIHAYSYIQQSGHSVKSMNAKNTKKSLIHDNADANITCDFGDGDISRSRSRSKFFAKHTDYVSDGHIISSIIVRYFGGNIPEQKWHKCCLSLLLKMMSNKILLYFYYASFYQHEDNKDQTSGSRLHNTCDSLLFNIPRHALQDFQAMTMLPDTFYVEP